MSAEQKEIVNELMSEWIKKPQSDEVMQVDRRISDGECFQTREETKQTMTKEKGGIRRGKES